MRTRERSLTDPLAGHGRIARQEFGIKTGRESDEETRIAIEQFGQVPAKNIPRIAGPIYDQTIYAALDVLARAGLVINGTDLASDLPPGPYHGNAGIKLVGVPPVSVGTGPAAGTSPTVTLNDATDNSGRITLTEGTPAGAAGNLLIITFARPKQNADYGIFLSAADSDASTAAGRSVYADFGARTTTTWELACSTALTAGTSYHWDYLIIERESL